MDTAAIKERVHELYWNEYTNCTKSMLICLGELFDVEIEQQVFQATVGMLGTAGFGLQCGLVEGGLMFIGIYCNKLGKSKGLTVSHCSNFLGTFNQKFGSLKCFELRSNLKRPFQKLCKPPKGCRIENIPTEVFKSGKKNNDRRRKSKERSVQGVFEGTPHP